MSISPVPLSDAPQTMPAPVEEANPAVLLAQMVYPTIQNGSIRIDRSAKKESEVILPPPVNSRNFDPKVTYVTVTGNNPAYRDHVSVSFFRVPVDPRTAVTYLYPIGEKSSSAFTFLDRVKEGSVPSARFAATWDLKEIKPFLRVLAQSLGVNSTGYLQSLERSARTAEVWQPFRERAYLDVVTTASRYGKNADQGGRSAASGPGNY